MNTLISSLQNAGKCHIAELLATVRAHTLSVVATNDKNKIIVEISR